MATRLTTTTPADLGFEELRIAFASMLRRFPDLELVAAPQWKPTYVLRGLQWLQVRLPG